MRCAFVGNDVFGLRAVGVVGAVGFAEDDGIACDVVAAHEGGEPVVERCGVGDFAGVRGGEVRLVGGGTGGGRGLYVRVVVNVDDAGWGVADW
jgi:hypothetical protein